MVLKHYSVNFPQTYTSEKKKKNKDQNYKKILKKMLLPTSNVILS